MQKKIIDSFFEQHPEAKSGRLTMDEINQLLVKYQQQLNNRPIKEFDGLSPTQMNGLLYHPLLPECILQYRETEEEYLEQVPLLTLSEILLKEIKNQEKLKLTTIGNLPLHVCKILINQSLIKWKYMELNKRINEDSIPYLWPLKQYLIEGGLVKKQHNSLSLTKKGDIYLKQNKQFRFKHIFNYFSNRFHWGNFYDPYFNETCGQLGWAFSMILVSKYGDKTKDAHFYSNQIYQALGNQSLDVEKYNDIYAVRFFEFFCSWFGLIDYEIKRDIKSPYQDKYFVKKSMLFDKLFVVNMN